MQNLQSYYSFVIIVYHKMVWDLKLDNIHFSPGNDCNKPMFANMMAMLLYFYNVFLQLN